MTGNLIESSESALVGACFERIVKSSTVDVCREVPVLGRSADLAFVREQSLVTIEFKLRDWRRGIAQARDHLLAADYAYVCMPKRKISDTMREELGKTAVGLLFYREEGDWPFEEVVAASRSQETWPVARGWALNYIAENRGRETCQTGDRA